MYKEHYQFKAMPFAHDSDLNFIFLGQNYETSLAMLVSGLDKEQYLHVVLGEDGVGTTTFVKYVEKHIQHSCSVGFVDKEVESSSALLQFALESFGQKASKIELPEMVEQLRAILKVEFEKNNQQPSILIIDNVHKMAGESFQAINLLTSVNYENKKLLQLILVGNKDLQETLRVIPEEIEILWHHLNPLTTQETRNYILHRLKIAGTVDLNLFNEQVCTAIYKYSQGIPQNINALCHRLLLFTSAHQIENISTEQIQQFADDEKPRQSALSPVSTGTAQIAPDYFKKAWIPGAIFAGIGLALGFILNPYLTKPEETQIATLNETKIIQEKEQQQWLDTLSGKTPDTDANIFQETEPLNQPDNILQASIPVESSAKNEHVEELLAVAKQQLQASKLLTPSQDNAYKTYTAILAITANDKRAISGLREIADRYLTLANKSFDQGDFLRSKTLISRGLKALPRHKQLLVLSKKISGFDLEFQEQNQQAKILLSQGKRQLASLKLITPEGDNAYQSYLKIFTFDKTNLQAKQGIQEIQHLLSSQLQDVLTKTQLDKSARVLVQQVLSAPDKELYLQNTLATARQIEKRLNDKIIYLLSLAKQQEQLQQYFKPANNNATATYKMVLGIDQSNGNAKQGLNNISKQYKIATKFAFENGKTKQALIYANEAVTAFPENMALLELQSKISLSLSEQSRATGSIATEDTAANFKKRLRPFGNF